MKTILYIIILFMVATPKVNAFKRQSKSAAKVKLSVEVQSQWQKSKSKADIKSVIQGVLLFLKKFLYLSTLYLDYWLLPFLLDLVIIFFLYLYVM